MLTISQYRKSNRPQLPSPSPQTKKDNKTKQNKNEDCNVNGSLADNGWVSQTEQTFPLNEDHDVNSTEFISSNDDYESILVNLTKYHPPLP